MSNQSEEGLKQAYGMLEKGNPAEAKKILADILEFNLDNSEIDFAIWVCSYWIDCIKSLSSMSSYEQGEKLLFQWKAFEDALSKKKEVYQRAVFSAQTGIFSLAQTSCSVALSESSKMPAQKAELLLKLGICSKKLGNYDEARNALIEANKLQQGNAEILAEMADCCALCGMESEAKILFREAFFIDAKKVDLQLLDSELIKSVVRRVKADHGYSGQELGMWVPVYAVLYRVFNIKRELRSVEVLKLKQDIYELEMEIKNPANSTRLLKPKLIYMYFRIVDYYIQKGESGSELNDILLKIKILDKDIYEQYMK